MSFVQSELLSAIKGVVHGFSNRSVGTDTSDIERAFNLAGVAQLKQIHSGDVIVVDNIENHDDLTEGDALVADIKNIGVGIRTADCVPILIVDSNKSIVAAVHAGWRGTWSQIAKNTVNLLENKYGIAPSDLNVAIGPSIKKCCYEVGEDVASLFSEKFEDTEQYLFQTEGSKYFLDLSIANKLALHKAGVSEIDVLNICTKCNTDFYSYRREGKGVSTQLSFVALSS